jgi:hypothetical protein
VDVTIGCEDGNISAHKVVLSSSSPYFRQRRYFSLSDQTIRHQSFGYESRKYDPRKRKKLLSLEACRSMNSKVPAHEPVLVT